MPYRVALVLLAALLLRGPVVGAEGAGWQEFVSPEGRFRVLLPGSPAHRSDTTSTPIGDVVNHTFVARSARGSYSISYSDIPVVGIAFQGGPEGIFTEARNALLEGMKGQATAYNRIRVGGRNGRELVYTAPGDPGQPALAGRTHLVMVGSRLYVVDSVVPVDGPLDEAERFLGSFKLLKKE